MQIPLEITFRDVAQTDEIYNLIMSKAEKLDQVCDHIISCRVVVERLQRHQHSAQPYHVRINMKLPPGHALEISRDPAKGDLHLDLAAEVRWAFETAERQLVQLMERQRKDIKTHPYQSTQGIVARLFPDQQYGFIKGIDGRELYFHEHSVVHGDFGKLRVGTGVRFTEEMGEKGPQASTVQIVETPG